MFYAEPNNVLIFRIGPHDLCVKIDFDNNRVFLEEHFSDGSVTASVYTLAFSFDASEIHSSGVNFENYIRKVMSCDD